MLGDLINLYVQGFTLNDDLKEAEDYSIESYLIHGILEVTLFGGMGLSLVIFILLLLIIYLSCIRGACSQSQISRTERQMSVIRTIRKFPFGDIIFREA